MQRKQMTTCQHHTITATRNLQKENPQHRQENNNGKTINRQSSKSKLAALNNCRVGMAAFKQTSYSTLALTKSLLPNRRTLPLSVSSKKGKFFARCTVQSVIVTLPLRSRAMQR